MEDLIERLEAINKTLYSKFGSESYTERCLIQDVKTEMQALILPVVGVTLPTTEEIELRLKQVVDKGFKEYEVVEKREYSLGFRACYNWLKIKQMKAGN